MDKKILFVVVLLLTPVFAIWHSNFLYRYNISTNNNFIIFINKSKFNFSDYYCRDLYLTNIYDESTNFFSFGCYKEIFPLFSDFGNLIYTYGSFVNHAPNFVFFDDFSTKKFTGNFNFSYMSFLSSSKKYVFASPLSYAKYDFNALENITISILTYICNNGSSLGLTFYNHSTNVSFGMFVENGKAKPLIINNTITLFDDEFKSCNFYLISVFENKTGLYFYIDNKFIKYYNFTPKYYGFFVNSTDSGILYYIISKYQIKNYNILNFEKRPNIYISKLGDALSTIGIYVNLLDNGIKDVSLTTFSKNVKTSTNYNSSYYFFNSFRNTYLNLSYVSNDSLLRLIYFDDTNCSIYHIIEFLPNDIVKHVILSNSNITYDMLFNEPCVSYSSLTGYKTASIGNYFSPEGIFVLKNTYLYNIHNMSCYSDHAIAHINLNKKVVFWESKNNKLLRRNILLLCNISLSNCDLKPVSTFYYSGGNYYAIVKGCDNYEINGLKYKIFRLKEGINKFTCFNTTNKIEIQLFSPSNYFSVLPLYTRFLFVNINKPGYYFIRGNYTTNTNSCYDGSYSIFNFTKGYYVLVSSIGNDICYLEKQYEIVPYFDQYLKFFKYIFKIPLFRHLNPFSKIYVDFGRFNLEMVVGK